MKKVCSGVAGATVLSVLAFGCESERNAASRFAARFGFERADFSGSTAGSATAAAKPAMDAALAENHFGSPERHSGPNQTLSGADALVIAGVAHGRVSHKDGNRTDWYRLVLGEPGIYRLDFLTHENGVGLEADIFEDGVSRPLKATDVIEIVKPRNLYVRVGAPEPLAHGTYSLSLVDSMATPEETTRGQVLRYNGVSATLDIGAEDGMKVGLEGVIHRKDASRVRFVVRKVLKRSSNVEVQSPLGPNDLGMHAHVAGSQAAMPRKAR